MEFKRLNVAVAIAALGFPVAAAAQSSIPAMPTLTPEQSAQVSQQIASERATMEARVGRGEVIPDEAERFLAWREWQIARQVTGTAPPPSTVQQQAESPAPPRYVYAPPPSYYGPAPYYWAPRYYWGPTICAGGWGHHVAGRVCF
jgi:hypothetical protein